MRERYKATTKAPEAKSNNPVSKAQKTNFSQSINLAVDQILFLQRAIGNSAMQRLILDPSNNRTQQKRENSYILPYYKPTGDFRVNSHMINEHTDQNIIQREALETDDPRRFRQIHENLFVNPPGDNSEQEWLEWTDTTEEELRTEFIAYLETLYERDSDYFEGTTPIRTTQSTAENLAVNAGRRVFDYFPQISGDFNEEFIRSRVRVFNPESMAREARLPQNTNQIISAPSLIEQRVINMLISETDIVRYNIRINQYEVRNSDQRVVDLIDSLLNDSTWGARLALLACRVAGFTNISRSGQRHIYINQGNDPNAEVVVELMGTLIHEIVTFYADNDYKRWVGATTSPRTFDEGFTEYLARKVMNIQEIESRTSYDDRLNTINDHVVRFVSEDDIAMAYFAGEVWRLESQSDISQEMFMEHTGLAAGATRQEEITQSHGAGFVSIVTETDTRAHYRFMNLGVNEHEPKPEHREFFTDMDLHENPGARLRFVGYASSPGSRSHNEALSRRRSQAFYDMARSARIPESQLIDADNPPHRGEARPTAENQDIHGRAFNRRVELFITQQ